LYNNNQIRTWVLQIRLQADKSKA